MKKIAIMLILLVQACAFGQGSIIYRAGSAVTTGNDIDLNLDGLPDFTLTHPATVIGDDLVSSRRLSPVASSTSPLLFSGELMRGTVTSGGIDWMAGDPILLNPGPMGEWTTTALNMRHLLVAVRLRDGSDWNLGWMRFEKIGEDSLGDIWGLRDAAYNFIPNAPINMLQVPEPSIITMALVGCGTWLVLARRRPRNSGP